MKTLLLTIATAATALTFSSCCCSNSSSQCETKHYDSKGRLVKKVLPSGNYNTYYYDGNGPEKDACSKSHTSKSTTKATHDGSWKPKLP